MMMLLLLKRGCLASDLSRYSVAVSVFVDWLSLSNIEENPNNNLMMRILLLLKPGYLYDDVDEDDDGDDDVDDDDEDAAPFKTRLLSVRSRPQILSIPLHSLTQYSAFFFVTLK